MDKETMKKIEQYQKFKDMGFVCDGCWRKIRDYLTEDLEAKDEENKN